MLGVLLQVVVVQVGGGLPLAGAGGDGGQRAVLGDDIRADAALCPGNSFGSLGVFPAGGRKKKKM